VAHTGKDDAGGGVRLGAGVAAAGEDVADAPSVGAGDPVVDVAGCCSNSSSPPSVATITAPALAVARRATPAMAQRALFM
jgi:hypothetical protein